jgi:hypothetical protein
LTVFSELDWTRLDTHALIECRGVAAIESGQRAIVEAWLSSHGYVFVALEFSEGIADAGVAIGELLDWEGQFGYAMKPGRPNLDALSDGFQFAVPAEGGLVLFLRSFHRAWSEDAQWAVNFLDIAAKFSLEQMAQGKRFFTLLEIDLEGVVLIGLQFDALTIRSPFHLQPPLD